MKNRNFLQSVKCAWNGFIYALRREGNLRFELFAGVMVSFFALVYGLDRIEWAVLALTIFTVIGAELMNTGIEKAVDTATLEFDKNAMHSKDAASAAVTVSSIGAVIVGLLLFMDFAKLKETFTTIICSPMLMCIAGVLIILGTVFIIKFKE